MEQLLPAQIPQFLKRFRFRGGLLQRFQIRNRSANQSSGRLSIVALDDNGNARVRLRLEFDGVEEYRFQRRPGPGLVRLKEVRLAYLNGLFYLNLDAFVDDEPPTVIDFRASDAFIAARSLSWEIVPPSPPAT
jgi:hypothetical protein